MNADIENKVKKCATYIDYQQTEQLEKTMLYELLCKPWKLVGADIFSVNNNTFVNLFMLPIFSILLFVKYVTR